MPRIIKLAKGTYTASTITVDSSGRVITAASGSAGGGANELALAASAGQSGTYTANTDANRIAAYLAAGAGGGGSRNGNSNNNAGGNGGDGGYGLFSYSIPGHPFAQPYAVGSGGPGASNPNGTQGGGVNGGQTTIANVGTANGGTGGQAQNAENGPDGTAPSATYDLTPAHKSSRELVIPGIHATGGTGKTGYPQGAGTQGGHGGLLVFENKGT